MVIVLHGDTNLQCTGSCYKYYELAKNLSTNDIIEFYDHENKKKRLLFIKIDKLSNDENEGNCVLIKKNSIKPNLPSFDTYLSLNQKILLDDNLVSVCDLINEDSIVNYNIKESDSFIKLGIEHEYCIVINNLYALINN